MLAGKETIPVTRKGQSHEVELLPTREAKRGSKINPIPFKAGMSLSVTERMNFLTAKFLW